MPKSTNGTTSNQKASAQQKIIKRMKRQATKWEKIFANHIYDKELRVKIYEELIQLDSKSKNTNNPIYKRTKDPNRYFSKEIKVANRYIIRCSASLIIGKCKS